jgi:SAM-dependent methyltransferase
MNWKLKATLQNIFSHLPNGKNINYFFQKNVTKNLPINESKIQEKLEIANIHIDNFREYGNKPFEQAIFYEFGAGWDIAQPLIFYSLGINHQILVDIRKLVKIELINNSIQRLQDSNISNKVERVPKHIIDDKNNLVSLLKELYGIDYRAPADARDTKIKEKTIDCITSTNTLEHIPPEDIKAILKESHRILRDDGIMSFQIDYQDHYSYFDKNISVYNFLEFSEINWNLFFNPSLHYQNRLRHNDYLDIIDDVGFEILSDKYIEGQLADIEKIKSLDLDQKFSKYSLSELAVRGTQIVLRKKSVSV